MNNTKTVIVEFSEIEQQFHFNYHNVPINTNGYQSLQTFPNSEEALFVGEFLENVREAMGKKMTFTEMKILSTEARLLLRNYNEAILGTPLMN
jgi:hypothetical protein